MASMGYSGAQGKLNNLKKPEAKNLVAGFL
jgi:hypothetical protein